VTDPTEIAKAYDPRETEARTYAKWERENLFAASSAPDDQRETYTIAIPPPNVTGVLHMGHACRVTFEDVLIRYHRMLGRNTLWIPGTDHAGIATQVVVERQLKKENKTRHELGRDAFIERVWKWKAESGGQILNQLRVLGASCDWSRERFTMDDGLSRAVREVFIRLYSEGLIYRATRLISWCTQCRTALSDLEVENEENASGELFDFAYRGDDGSEIVVSTTRPETMLGDTAIAVHPDDPRHRHLHGKQVRHPFVDRLIPIITDAVLVDMKFGTGAVKVTPAHDANDFATGKRHALEEINILNLDGTLNDNGGPFAGMDRFVARKAVKAKLEELGLARGQKAHTLTKPKCQRCATIVEPIISTQWFMKMEPLAQPAIEAVESGKTQIIPEHWAKTYFHWMRNIQDWCISRQLWWGHQVPAYYCDACNAVHVAQTAPSTCTSCGSTTLRADPDVLDTWFSSALWPFSTLGWPDKTLELSRFYPTSDMETGYDILFFWVARMMMMGIHFMGEVPFKRILLAGMVTDERGDKMSKVKGNVIDPLDVINGATIDQLIAKAEYSGASASGIDYLRKTYPEGFPAYGADALRFTLLSYSPQTTKIALSIKRIEGYRNFCNKLWNANRYALMNLTGTDAAATGACPAPSALANRWILSRLAAAIATARESINNYRLDEASGALYHFVWDDLCDWYLELSKPLLASDDEALVRETRATLVHVLETSLRALHPMIPFITEELWQGIPKSAGGKSSIMISDYPSVEVSARSDATSEADMAILQHVIVAARTVRAEYDVAPSKPLTLALRCDSTATLALLRQQQRAVEALCRAVVTIETGALTEAPPDTVMKVVDDVCVVVSLAGLIDPAKELERTERELRKVEKDLLATQKKLSNAGFVDRAPKDVVDQERARLVEMEATFARLTAALARLKAT